MLWFLWMGREQFVDEKYFLNGRFTILVRWLFRGKPRFNSLCFLLEDDQFKFRKDSLSDIRLLPSRHNTQVQIDKTTTYCNSLHNLKEEMFIVIWTGLSHLQISHLLHSNKRFVFSFTILSHVNVLCLTFEFLKVRSRWKSVVVLSTHMKVLFDLIDSDQEKDQFARTSKKWCKTRRPRLS